MTKTNVTYSGVSVKSVVSNKKSSILACVSDAIGAILHW